MAFVVDARALRAHFSSITFERGRGIYLGQQVPDYALEPLGSRVWRVSGHVQGTQPEPYEVSVRVGLTAQGGVQHLHGVCSCPVGLDCKHVVAVMLKAAMQGGAHAQGRSSSVLTRVGQWLDRLEQAAQPPGPPDPDAARAQQPLYLLRVRRPSNSEQPRLELAWRVSHRLKSGKWAKPRNPGYDAVYQMPQLRQGSGSADSECVQLLRGLLDIRFGAGPEAWSPVCGAAGQLALQACAATERLFYQDGQGDMAQNPLRWGEARPIDWQWSRTAGEQGVQEWQLASRLAGPGTAPDDEPPMVFAGPPSVYLDTRAQVCGLVRASGVDAQRLALLLAAPPMPEAAFADPASRLLMQLAPVSLPPGVQAPQPWPVAAPTAHLALAPVPHAERARQGLVVAVLRFDYAGLRGWWPQHTPRVLADATVDGIPRRVLLTRDLAAEDAALARLQALGLAGDRLGWHHQRDAAVWLGWAARDWAPLRDAGFELDLAPGLDTLVHLVDEVDLRMDDGADASAPGELPAWFDLSLGVEIAGQRHNILPWLPDWLAQVRQDADGPELPEWLWREQDDGTWLRLPSAPLLPWLRVLLELMGERGPRGLSGDALRLSRLEALRLGATLGEGAHWSGAAQLRAMLGQLLGAGVLPEVAVPQGLHAQLRPYQQHGLNWLQFLRQHQLGGVLADDMGLGKTLQTLAHLLCEKEAGRMDRPCLVIAPVSLLGNWRREAERFAPGLRTRVWHGLGRHGGAFAEDCDLLIAPYSLLQRDRARWLEQRWHVVVLDEAQHIKNATTQAAQVAGQLDARQRLALSGTPLENHLGELWSLFHYLMPGFLGSAARFRDLFRTPIEKHGDTDTLTRLRQRVTPFMLRRTKAAVAAELPECIESLSMVELQGRQADLYETIRLATEQAVRDALANRGLARSQIQVLDALLKLRQVCCDPRLVKTPAAARVKTSAKLEQLMELLAELLAEGRRVLLFSQFTSMLALIEAELERAGIAWTKLTGQTHKRDAAIERFTSGQVPLFLISLKAGGTGLNLPQADTVIHYDPWWNPAVQAQATGRAHRIGQTRQVMVYKLVAAGTIEERILALQERKAALADGLLTGAAQREQPLFTEADVAELLRPLGG